MGRVTSHQQTTDGQTYTTAYAYNLAGALIEETYPSGRVVNTLDATGDLAIVESRKTPNGVFSPYADTFTYNAAGAVTSMRLGNGLWESTQFNSRLQPTMIALGTAPNGTDKLKLEYGYGSSNNNGNVLSQTITVPGLAQPFVQNYTYDSLNRVASATETNNGQQTWTQVFGYDRYGNRNVVSGSDANEDRLPTDGEMNLMVDRMRMQYLETYGKKAYEQAVTEAERKKTAERIARQETDGGIL